METLAAVPDLNLGIPGLSEAVALREADNPGSLRAVGLSLGGPGRLGGLLDGLGRRGFGRLDAVFAGLGRGGLVLAGARGGADFPQLAARAVGDALDAGVVRELLDQVDEFAAAVLGHGVLERRAQGGDVGLGV